VVWGEDPVFDSLLAGKSVNYNQATTAEPFGGRVCFKAATINGLCIICIIGYC
jgi:hypothetical protein